MIKTLTDQRREKRFAKKWIKKAKEYDDCGLNECDRIVTKKGMIAFYSPHEFFPNKWAIKKYSAHAYWLWRPMGESFGFDTAEELVDELNRIDFDFVLAIECYGGY